MSVFYRECRYQESCLLEVAEISHTGPGWLVAIKPRLSFQCFQSVWRQCQQCRYRYLQPRRKSREKRGQYNTYTTVNEQFNLIVFLIRVCMASVDTLTTALRYVMQLRSFWRSSVKLNWCLEYFCRKNNILQYVTKTYDVANPGHSLYIFYFICKFQKGK